MLFDEPLKCAQKMVRDFHVKFDCTVNDVPTVLNHEESNFRLFLVQEEIDELKEAIFREDLVQIADALADSIYVLLGTAVAYGIDLDLIFREVQRSNMTKTPTGRHNDKPLKGIRFTRPQIARLRE